MTNKRRRAGETAIKASDGELTGEAFDALPDAEKERIWQEIDEMTPEQIKAQSRPLNAKERAIWREIKSKMGRPKSDRGTTVISLSVERDLLEAADAYAKKRKMTRAQLVAKGLAMALGGNWVASSSKRASVRRDRRKAG
ncbi:MAG TPA: hypothetical protein VFC78_20625 [Tepidisphaeraceae bacterium]|nr:hypothetical protein [Tepidisphaeraceae bacterium]